MGNFNTIEEAQKLFEKTNGLGKENCFFITFKDTNREGMKYGLLGGAVGGALGAATAMAIGAAERIDNNFDGLLINETENGLGIIPLISKGIQLVLSVEKLEAQPENYVFISNDNIEQIIVKNFNVFNKKVQIVKIKIKNGQTLHLMAHVKEKSIPYQEENFNKFMNKYKK